MTTRRDLFSRLAAFAVLPNAAAAQAVDLSSIPFSKAMITEASVSFLLPTDAETDFDPPIRNFGPDLGMIGSRKPSFSIAWRGGNLDAYRFDVGYDFYHADWLTAHADLLGWSVREAFGRRNDVGFPFGRLAFVAPETGSTERLAFLAVAGREAIFFESRNEIGNILALAAIGQFEYSGGGQAWNGLTDRAVRSLPPLEFEAFSRMPFTEAVGVDKQVEALYLHDRPALEDSFLRFTARRTKTAAPGAAVVAFQKLMSKEAIIRVLEQDRDSTALSMLYPNGELYLAYFYSTPAGIDVSLVVPSYIDDAQRWLIGRKIYTDALLALESL